MSVLRRWGALCTIVISTAALTAKADGAARNPSAAPPGQPALVDLSGATLSGQGATAGRAEVSAPIVEAASKKKKPAPSLWNRMWHPSQWFSGSKSKK